MAVLCCIDVIEDKIDWYHHNAGIHSMAEGVVALVSPLVKMVA